MSVAGSQVGADFGVGDATKHFSVKKFGLFSEKQAIQ